MNNWGSALLQAGVLNGFGGSDHVPVGITPRPERPSPTTHPVADYSPMAVGGFAMDGINAGDILDSAGMRYPLRNYAQTWGAGLAPAPPGWWRSIMSAPSPAEAFRAKNRRRLSR
jgi:hypothetical protein